MSTNADAVKVSSGITMSVTVIAEPIVKMVKNGTLKITELQVQDKNEDTIKLSLFGEQADGIVEGTKLQIIDGSTNEFRGEISLQVPRWGSIKID